MGGDSVPTGRNASEINGDEAEPIYSEPVAETVRTFLKIKKKYISVLNLVCGLAQFCL